MKKTLAIVGAVTAVGLSSAAGASVVSAHNDMNANGSSSQKVGMSLLGLNLGLNANATASADVDYADKIATKLGMNKDDVQKVLTEYRNVKIDERRQALSDRLDKAVQDGKLTREKADMILAKFDDVRAFVDSLQGKTPEERQTAIKQKLDELRTWAKDNNISSSLLKMDDNKYHTMSQDKSASYSMFNL